jgi:hypothetical protein
MKDSAQRCIMPLGTENSIKEGKRQGGINLLFTIDYLVFF